MYVTGQVLTVTSIGIPLVTHSGVVLIEESGQYVLSCGPEKQNSRGGSVVKEPLAVFLDGRQVLRVKSTGVSADRIVSVSDTLQDRAYNVFTFNCEHYENAVTEGRMYSPQLVRAIIVIGLIVMILNGIRR